MIPNCKWLQTSSGIYNKYITLSVCFGCTYILLTGTKLELILLSSYLKRRGSFTKSWFSIKHFIRDLLCLCGYVKWWRYREKYDRILPFMRPEPRKSYIRQSLTGDRWLNVQLGHYALVFISNNVTSLTFSIFRSN